MRTLHLVSVFLQSVSAISGWWERFLLLMKVRQPHINLLFAPRCFISMTTFMLFFHWALSFDSFSISALTVLEVLIVTSTLGLCRSYTWRNGCLRLSMHWPSIHTWAPRRRLILQSEILLLSKIAIGEDSSFDLILRILDDLSQLSDYLTNKLLSLHMFAIIYIKQ